MKKTSKWFIENLIERYPQLNCCMQDIEYALELMISCYLENSKLLVCGNGGSASDSEHIVGELMKGFLLERKLGSELKERIENITKEDAPYLLDNLQLGLPAISLVSQSALISAFSNDRAPDLAFAQQVLNYGNRGDVLIAISTSGNSKNVLHAAQVAKARDLKVISLTGQSGGKLLSISDCTIRVPSTQTYIIQEYHLPVYHALCAALEAEFFTQE